MKRLLCFILILTMLSGCSVRKLNDEPLTQSAPLDRRTGVVIASGYDIVTLDPHEATDT